MENHGKQATHPVLEALIARKDDCRQAVVLTGYLGPSETNTICLYPSLDVARCIEIAEDAVLDIDDGEGLEGRVHIYVDADAEVNITLRAQRRMVVGDLQVPINAGDCGSSASNPTAALRHAPAFTFPPVGGGDLKCALDYLDCLVTGSTTYCETQQNFCRLLSSSGTLTAS